MVIGGHVRITVRGTFNGFVGVIRDIRQTTYNSRVFYWIEIPDHPWSKRDNPLWSFERHEFEEDQ